MGQRILDGADEVLAAVGQHLGTSAWLEITQDRVDRFAESTGDHQWIHTDPDRAAEESPYGGTIAHGYLTLALTNQFLPEIVEVRGFAVGVNYGCDRVRFPAPVPVGCRVRGAATLTDATEVPGGIQTTVTVTVEVEGRDKPACVVEAISRYLEA